MALRLCCLQFFGAKRRRKSSSCSVGYASQNHVCNQSLFFVKPSQGKLISGKFEGCFTDIPFPKIQSNLELRCVRRNYNNWPSQYRSSKKEEGRDLVGGRGGGRRSELSGVCGQWVFSVNPDLLPSTVSSRRVCISRFISCVFQLCWRLNEGFHGFCSEVLTGLLTPGRASDGCAVSTVWLESAADLWVGRMTVCCRFDAISHKSSLAVSGGSWITKDISIVFEREKIFGPEPKRNDEYQPRFWRQKSAR